MRALVSATRMRFSPHKKHIRNITNTTTDVFKSKLDQFLTTVDDHPHLRSGANNGRHNNSNHLFDIIDSNYIEPFTSGVSNRSPQGDEVLPRRLSAEELTILRR